MTSTKGNLRITFVLFVHVAICSLCSCAAIKTGQLSTRDDAADKFPLLTTRKPISDRYTTKRIDWKRFSTHKPIDWSRFSWKPIDWNEFTTKPIDWNEVTEEPIDWERFTVEPLDWNLFTWHWNIITMKPIEWNGITENPYDKISNRNKTQLKLIIILPTLFFIFLIFLCKYFICRKKDSTFESTPTLHLPPVRIIPPRQNTRQNQTSSSQNRTTSQNTTESSRAFAGTDNYAFTRDDSGVSRSNDDDKPPDYSEVVMSDFFNANKMKFPEVAPNIPTTSPPKYDEGNILKY